MAWYDVFSRMYDRFLEGLYRPYRLQALATLLLPPQALVLDLAGGTAQNLTALNEKRSAVDGRYIGVEPSVRMRRQARQRSTRAPTPLLQCHIGERDAPLTDAPEQKMGGRLFFATATKGPEGAA